MNHCSSPEVRSSFIQTVQDSPQIKLWCSGHFHLSQDFPDSLSRVNQCTFVQVGVVGAKSTRDHTRQTRIVQGNSQSMKIYTINHHLRDENGQAALRLDAVLDLEAGDMDICTVAWDDDDNIGNEMENGAGRQRGGLLCDEYETKQKWFGAYIPREEDGCYVENPSGTIASKDDIDQIGKSETCLICFLTTLSGAHD